MIYVYSNCRIYTFPSSGIFFTTEVTEEHGSFQGLDLRYPESAFRLLEKKRSGQNPLRGGGVPNGRGGFQGLETSEKF